MRLGDIHVVNIELTGEDEDDHADMIMGQQDHEMTEMVSGGQQRGR